MYNKYSDYLKMQYGEKVYKIPIHLEGTCPNRDGVKGIGGCIFCGEVGTGFEMLPTSVAPDAQLIKNMAYIGHKYKAQKFIAYFQNFTGTYMPLENFKTAIEAVLLDSVVGISVSTRPDCIHAPYLEYLKTVKERGYSVEFELGLQSINPTTLKKLNRGHTLTDYLEAVQMIQSYGFTICTHLIGNLPWDSDEDFYEAARLLSFLKIDGVKVHSLYILKNTELGRLYEANAFSLIDPDAYVDRLVHFLRLLSPDIAVQRLFGRAPEADTLFCNWGMSWRKLQNQLEEIMFKNRYVQGDLCRRLL